jgi:hypothetical protein
MARHDAGFAAHGAAAAQRRLSGRQLQRSRRYAPTPARRIFHAAFVAAAAAASTPRFTLSFSLFYYAFFIYVFYCWHMRFIFLSISSLSFHFRHTAFSSRLSASSV